MAQVTFMYDVACPYAYLGSRRIEAVAARCNARVVWKPVLLGGIYLATAAPQGKDGSASDVMAPAKKILSARDLRLQCKRAGVTLNWHPNHPVRSVDAQRLLCAAPDALRPVLTHALYKAYWVENQPVNDRAFLLATAAAVGVKVDVSVFDNDKYKEILRANTEEAVQLGAPGVPGFVVGDRLYWGSDRLNLVELALGNKHAAQLRAMPKPAAPLPAKRVVTFYYDFSSPWSYLGHTQIDRVVAEAGSGVVLEEVPMLLGAVFKDIGTPNVPMRAMSEQKRNYMGKDMSDWQEWWTHITGKPVVLNWPSKFPIRSVLPLRVAVVEPRTRRAIYKAAWVDDKDIADEGVLAHVLNEAGFNGSALIKAAGTDDAKTKLTANTKRAIEAGVCGAPSFQVNGGGVIWGQDRLDVVADELAGWQFDAIEHTSSKL